MFAAQTRSQDILRDKYEAALSWYSVFDTFKQALDDRNPTNSLQFQEEQFRKPQ